MRLELERDFELDYPGPPEEAAAFLADPARSLARVPFLAGLRVQGDEVAADLMVDAPLLGPQRLDFRSRLRTAPAGEHGADLVPLARSGRAWAEVAGSGRAEPAAGGSRITYRLRVVVHLELPDAGSWGGRALARMAGRAAESTLERVTEEFPAAVRAAMPARP